MDLASTLWRANQDLAKACSAHPFVRGLADGSLPISSFRHYVAQDAFFLEAFARAYASALALAPDRAGLEAFYALIGGVLEELKLHAAYAGRWGVELSNVTPADDTRAYTAFLQLTARGGSLGEICAAMAPCMRLYSFLGQTLAAEGADQPANPYHEWIQTYASPGFEALAAQLEALLNAYAQDTTSVRTAYRRAMQLEEAFFTAAV
jgi:thiaminase (transcriptional activator TenA)